MYHLNVHLNKPPVTSKVRSTAPSEEHLLLLSKPFYKYCKDPDTSICSLFHLPSSFHSCILICGISLKTTG